jgi:hypothetical protein
MAPQDCENSLFYATIVKIYLRNVETTGKTAERVLFIVFSLFHPQVNKKISL